MQDWAHLRSTGKLLFGVNLSLAKANPGMQGSLRGQLDTWST